MESKTFQWLRVLVPGILLMVLVALLILIFYKPLNSFSDVFSIVALEFTKMTLPVLLCVALGGIYYYLHISDLVDESCFGHMRRVNENIRDRLVGAFDNDPEIAQHQQKLSRSAIQRVFYELIDETPSLKTKVELAFSYGLGFYSFLDLFTIALFGEIITMLLLAFVTPANPNVGLVSLLALFGLVFLSLFGMDATIKSLSAESNIQIDMILASKKAELKNKLKQALPG